MTYQITWIHWLGFIAAVIFFLALDLGVFHRKAHTVRFKEALIWTGIWATIAMIFAWGLSLLRGQEEAVEFITGYIVELSLSMDNVFVIAMIFRYFSIPLVYQHRVLFWGIIGALVMRGLMIGVGAALVQQFKWTLFIFGLFLIYSGIKMLFLREEGVDFENNFVIKLVQKWLPLSPVLETHHFITRIKGRRMLTPLAIVLVMVETTDLIFALDSIPAIFGITTKEFIVFTSNVFAILGLRSLYFVLAGAMEYFRFLKIGLSLVLVFIGTKMLLPTTFHLSSVMSLGIVGSILLTSVGVSLIYRWLPASETEEAGIEQK